jgi:cell division protein ZapA (FtsZ GTPase activity inhibitor)
MSKQTVAVRIAGHDYKILSEGDPSSLQKIAKHVDQAMARVRDRTGMVDTLDISVLTCLNLAREILALREQQNETVEDDRIRSLIERVETSLGGEISSDESESGNVAATDAEPSRGTSEISESARTLDLPSVEALRDRAPASSEAKDRSAVESSMPEQRIAAGGRERAS